MTQINWKDNNHSGGFVERSLRQLETYIENTKNPARRMILLQRYITMWEIKARVGRPDKQSEEIAALKQELDNLKKMAGMAQANQIEK
jgi:hypothetical protein